MKKCSECNKNCEYRDSSTNGFCYFGYLHDEFDWKVFHRNAAKEFVSVIYPTYNVNVTGSEIKRIHGRICSEAIALADELIKQLKKYDEDSNL